MNLQKPCLGSLCRNFRGDVWRHLGPSLSARQKRVLTNIAQCRTAALGGHVERCSDCGRTRVWYNSCRDRHCPNCQAMARAQWLEQRSAELLPVPYFHVVFTLPETLAPLALQNPSAVYGLLFRSAFATMLELADDPKHLGARLGGLAVLHTWGQNLWHHPHLHCVVAGGGMANDGGRWIACRRSRKNAKAFFLPVRVLSKVFRGKFLAGLRALRRAGKLKYCGSLAGLADPAAFHALLGRSAKTPWVVYAKRPFGGPRQVLEYLARYTHRVAISDGRLLSLEGNSLRFALKDYRNGGKPTTATLGVVEFLRRFLLHVLPKGFRRIRHFGFLANRDRAAHLEQCRNLLKTSSAAVAPTTPEPNPAMTDGHVANDPFDHGVCPFCNRGRMRVFAFLGGPSPPTIAWVAAPAPMPSLCNSS